MNERIQKLAEQATELDYETFDNYNHKTVKQYKFNKEKFAELIVAECLRQVEEQYKPVLEDTEMMKDTHWDGYVQCGVDSYVAIKEHFYGEQE